MNGVFLVVGELNEFDDYERNDNSLRVFWAMVGNVDDPELLATFLEKSVEGMTHAPFSEMIAQSAAHYSGMYGDCKDALRIVERRFKYGRQHI